MKKNNKNVTNKKTSNKTSKQVTAKQDNSNNIGFNDDKSFHYDEDNSHSFEVRDCK